MGKVDIEEFVVDLTVLNSFLPKAFLIQDRVIWYRVRTCREQE